VGRPGAVPVDPVTAVGVTAMLACAVAGMAGWQGGPGHGVIVAGAGLLVGVPHGSVDHLLPSPRAGRRPRGRVLAGFLGAYLAATLAFVAFSVVLPAPALAVFVLVSLVHFGTADIAYNHWRRGSSGPDDSVDLIVQTIAYGGCMSALFFLRWPHQVGAVLAFIGPAQTGSLGTALRAIGYLTLTATAVTVVRHIRRGTYLEAAELGVLLLAAWTAPPLVAFGVYFAAWHALRHSARVWPALPGLLALVVERRYGRAGALGLLHLLPATIGAYLVFVLALLAVRAGGSYPHPGMRVVGAVLAGVTVPHVGLVLRYDRRLLVARRHVPSLLRMPPGTALAENRIARKN
jgi:Brp/Blh family beta-carotene 15,15'-monooxygenase